jgi:antirestriction protein ArdC
LVQFEKREDVGGKSDGSDHEENGRQTESRFIHICQHRVYTVFNANRIDRIPAQEPKAHSAFAAVETDERILRNSGAEISHDRPTARSIRAQPIPSTFRSASCLSFSKVGALGYYGTALRTGA